MSESHIYSTTGAQQAGYVRNTTGQTRASIWNGAASSWVNLHPTALNDSQAFDTTGVHQAGFAVVGGAWHASRWNGTAASWTDLNPAGASESLAYSVSGLQQAGYATFGGISHAGLWNGTAASWIDLHPAGSLGSYITDNFGTQQVGVAFVDGFRRASLWTGTAASRVDLSSFLTGSWGHTQAQGIWSDGTTTTVVGWGFNNASGRDEALLWRWTIPAPGPAFVIGMWGVVAGRARRRVRID